MKGARGAPPEGGETNAFFQFAGVQKGRFSGRGAACNRQVLANFLGNNHRSAYQVKKFHEFSQLSFSVLMLQY
jgi:hypothetical protein